MQKSKPIYFRGQEISSRAELKKMPACEMLVLSKGILCFCRGKYKGSSVKDIEEKNENYVFWCCDNVEYFKQDYSAIANENFEKRLEEYHSEERSRRYGCKRAWRNNSHYYEDDSRWGSYTYSGEEYF